jgi:hypothetical protein
MVQLQEHFILPEEYKGDGVPFKAVRNFLQASIEAIGMK